MAFDDQGVHTTSPDHLPPAASGQSGAALLNYLLRTTGTKNDSRLAKLLRMSAPVISKVRSGKLRVSDAFILRVHETLDIPVRQIRSILSTH